MSNNDTHSSEWRPDQLTGWWHMNVGDGKDGKFKCDHRSWEDCQKYSFMIAGGAQIYIDNITGLKQGDHLLAYANKSGYVGAGIVLTKAVPLKYFFPTDSNDLLLDLPLATRPGHDRLTDDDPEKFDWCVRVKWISNTRDRSKGVLGKESDYPSHYDRRPALYNISDTNLVRVALEKLDVTPNDLDGPMRQAA